MNIFNIEEKYLKLINTIEENDGVIELEQEKELSITLNELETKLKSYYYITQTLNGDITMIDDEITRLNKLKVTKKSIIVHLKSTIRDAVILFGDIGKSGNKVINYKDIKFYTRKNIVVQITDDFYNIDYAKYKLNEQLNTIQFNKIISLLKYNANDIKYLVTVDKKLLKDDLQNGVEVKNASLIRNDSVIIK